MPSTLLQKLLQVITKCPNFGDSRTEYWRWGKRDHRRYLSWFGTCLRQSYEFFLSFRILCWGLDRISESGKVSRRSLRQEGRARESSGTYYWIISHIRKLHNDPSRQHVVKRLPTYKHITYKHTHTALALVSVDWSLYPVKKMLWGQAREAQWRQAKAACVTGKKVAMIPGFLSECAHRLVVYHGLFIKKFPCKERKK